MKRVFVHVCRLLLIGVLSAQSAMIRADSDHEEARRLRQAGDILSLELILERLRPDYPGRVLEVELETEAGQTVYEIELLGDDGMVRELIVDARSGELLRSKRDD